MSRTLLPPEAADPAKVKTAAAGLAAVAQGENPERQSLVKKVGGSVHAPVLNAHREAEFNETARHLKYSGISEVGLIVNTDGLPDQLSVIRPLGLGLDEQALVAVQSYRFTPAMQNGKPVRVEVNVEVSFQTY